tara:strand:+ start:49 stop:249 length:201 start_codon:yes stop_codon:yes gene_type:complete
MTLLNVPLMPEEINNIIFSLEEYAQGNDNDELVRDLNRLMFKLDQVVVNYREKMLEAQAKQPNMEW